MTARCPKCGTRCNNDAARCANARALGLKLRRHLTVKVVEPATIEEAVQMAAKRRGR